MGAEKKALFTNYVLPVQKYYPKVCLGLAEREYRKESYCNHVRSFKHSMTLSSYVWEMKTKQKETPSLTWKIIQPGQAYSNITKKCVFCLHGKLLIVTYLNPSETFGINHKYQKEMIKNK